MGFSRATDRLLFLVYADPPAAAAAVKIGAGLRDEHDLRGALILSRHIHSTLWHVGDDFSPPPPALIATLTACAKRVSMPAFKVSFSRAESFTGGGGEKSSQTCQSVEWMCCGRIGGPLRPYSSRSPQPVSTAAAAARGSA